MVENENRIGWSQMLGLLVCLAWLFPPALNVAVGQEGTFIELNPPAEGAPPSPGRPVASLDSKSEKPVAEISEDSVLEAQHAGVETAEDSTAPDVEIPPAETEAAQVDQVELSVEPGSPSALPGSKPLLPENRPAWVGANPDYSGKNHRLFVGSLPMAKQSEADRGLDEPMMAAFNAYLDDHLLGSGDASQQLGLDDNFIRRNLINDPIGYMAEITTSEGPMYQKWVTLEVTPAQQKQLKKMHQEAVQLQRIKPLALGLLGLLGFVGVAHMTMKRKKGVASITPLDGEQLAAVDRPSQHMPAPGRRSSGFGWLFLVAMFFLPLGLVVLFLVPAATSVQRIEVQGPTATVDVAIPEVPAPTASPIPPVQPPSAEELLQTLQNSNGQVIIHESEGGQKITITTR